MAVLNDWQRIDRVILGKPYGTGSSGNATISSDPNTRATATGSSGGKSVTAGSSSFANGDVVLLIQYRSSTTSYIGQWEINRVASGGGTTSLTMQENLHYTYNTGAQIVKIPMYDQLTINSYTIPAWNGSTGGVSVYCGKTSITNAQTMTGTGKGFRGGAAKTDGSTTTGGEGGAGYNNRTYGAAGAVSSNPGAGGAYGGNGTDGGSTTNTYGLAYGSADLTKMTSGGSGGGASGSGVEGAGGASGHILFFITKSFTNSSTISANGATGQGSVSDRGGGGGSGGAILLVCNTATLGTMTASGGAAGSGVDANAYGGVGGTGRISIHHMSTVSGSSTPTYNDTTETDFIETDAGLLMNFI